MGSFILGMGFLFETLPEKASITIYSVFKQISFRTLRKPRIMDRKQILRKECLIKSVRDLILLSEKEFKVLGLKQNTVIPWTLVCLHQFPIKDRKFPLNVIAIFSHVFHSPSGIIFFYIIKVSAYLFRTFGWIRKM